jgi:UDPglucose 6-dehydrogenase
MSCDINAPDFVDSFKKEEACIGIVGQGFVGTAMWAYWNAHDVRTVAYDKYKKTGSTLDDIVKQSQVIFVCVPTPMRTSGECYTGIVEEVVNDIKFAASREGRSLDSFIICVKSTVPPGFTDILRQKHPSTRIVFSPEFLTEKNSIDDMLNANRVIVGGEMEDAWIVLRFFMAADQKRVEAGTCVLMRSTARAAEMAKLLANGLLFTKVLLCNEVYLLCKELGIRYDEVRTIAALDPRIGSSHTKVPGPDGFMGAGGHCFPKDMHNLRYTARALHVDERMFSAVLERNDEIREERDWEKMNDRAVTEK